MRTLQPRAGHHQDTPGSAEELVQTLALPWAAASPPLWLCLHRHQPCPRESAHTKLTTPSANNPSAIQGGPWRMNSGALWFPSSGL